MRVAFITTSLDPGGAETALAALATGLNDTGAKVVVIALGGSGRLLSQLNAAGVAARSLNAGNAAALAFGLPGVVRDLSKFRPDILQGWMYHGNLVASSVAPFCSGRLAWGVRQALGSLERERPATNRLIRFSARLSARVDQVIYNSERARADHEALGYSRTNASVIANGVDTDALRPDPAARARLRRDLNLDDEVILVGHFARYHPVKDHETFLRAVSSPEFRTSRAHLLMAGRGVEPTNQELVSAVRRLGLEGRVTLRGECENVASLLPGLDLFCLSSRSEAFPNVIAEAMSCGVPCVTTDAGDAAVIVGDTGLVVAPGDANQLAVALRAVAERGVEGRRALGAAARDRIRQRYPVDTMIEQYRRLYQSQEAQ